MTRPHDGEPLPDWLQPRGDAEADPLARTTYVELRRIADRLLGRERDTHTLQATDLVHEAYLCLCRHGELREGDVEAQRAFLQVSARVMRHVLVDHARGRAAQKRGGGRRKLSLDEITAHLPETTPDLPAVDDALEKLARMDERKARIVELRFFAGCTLEETAQVVGVSSATVERDWQFSKAWLASEIGMPSDA